jgi:uncharacterized glyoxalase superfamily protein PhnB
MERPVKPNRSIPPATVIPVLVYPDVRQAVAWLNAAFGFAERTRIGESHRAQMSIGEDGAVIVAEVRGEQQPPQEGVVTHVMKVRVEDVEAWYERARAHGARILEPPTDREYGERECTVEHLHRLDEGRRVGHGGRGRAQIELGRARARLHMVLAQRVQGVFVVEIGDVGPGELAADQGGPLGQVELGAALVGARPVGRDLTAAAPVNSTNRLRLP